MTQAQQLRFDHGLIRLAEPWHPVTRGRRSVVRVLKQSETEQERILRRAFQRQLMKVGPLLMRWLRGLERRQAAEPVVADFDDAIMEEVMDAVRSSFDDHRLGSEGQRRQLMKAQGLAAEAGFDSTTRFMGIRAPKSARYNLVNERALSWLEDHNTAFWTNTDADTMRRINRTLISGLRQGEDLEGLSARLMKTLEMGPVWRARMIAQTETIAAHARASEETASGLGITQMRWFDRQIGADSICLGLHNETKPLDGFYELDGIRYVRPPAHPGCRCVTMPVIKTDTPLVPAVPDLPQDVNPAQLRRTIAGLAQGVDRRVQTLARRTRKQAELVDAINPTTQRAAWQRALGRLGELEDEKSLALIEQKNFVHQIREDFIFKRQPGRVVFSEQTNLLNGMFAKPTPMDLQLWRDGLGDLGRMLGPGHPASGRRITMATAGDQLARRAFYTHPRLSRDGLSVGRADQITLPTHAVTSRTAVIHEAGHWLETRIPEVRREAQAFLDARTAGDQAVRLRDVTKNSAYGTSETTKPDKFMDPYVGKQYSRGASEVISMGMQFMYENPIQLALSDPQLFDLIWRILNLPKSTRWLSALEAAE